MKTPVKIALGIALALGLALLAGALLGCASTAKPGPVAPTNPAVAVPQPAGRNRALSELMLIARGDVPEPSDLSPADRTTVAQMRAARRR